jgi:hypothetical protein
VDGSVAVPSVESIQNAIMSFGPVSAAVCVDSNFQQYAGGVFKPKKPCNSVNHAIVLVGWDEPNNAWILRNSWGDSWGEGGYMRIDYSKSKVGYAAVYVNYNCANSDADNDGYDSPICGGDDCDDANASVNPGVANDPCNGVDDDCDGQVDEDCSCGPSGSYCTSKADCCSNRCKRNTCR